MRTVLDSETALGRRAIDALLECYVSWREECQEVRLAALDREECAARAYAEHIERLRRISTRTSRGRPAIFATTTTIPGGKPSCSRHS
jgi:hypothetical protein